MLRLSELKYDKHALKTPPAPSSFQKIWMLYGALLKMKIEEEGSYPYYYCVVK